MTTRWAQMKAVQRMQDHINANLHAPITLQGLARAARYSPYYAARIFKALTGKAPFEYIRELRLSEAARALQRDPTARVVDVAFDFVFDSHEGFTRAFSRKFGVSPSRARRGADVTPSLFLPGPMRAYYRDRQQGVSTMSVDKSNQAKPAVVFTQVLQRPARKLIFKRGVEATHYFEYCEEVGCEVWEKLGAVEGAIHEPMGVWIPDPLRPDGASRYAQGVEVPEGWSGEVPEGFEIIDLPPCAVMVFQGPPFDDADFEQAITTLWDVINSHDPRPLGYAWADDDGPRFQLEPQGYRGYIEGRPVRPVR